MVYKTASQKILIWLFIITFSITVISGGEYWKMWSILPTTFFMLWLAGKFNLPIGSLKAVFLPPFFLFAPITMTIFALPRYLTDDVDVMFMDEK